MTSVTKQFSFAAAHRLLNHEGKCVNLHGHTYHVEVTCEGETDAMGRVVDFGVIKATFGAWLDKHFDHACILEKGDPLIGVLAQMLLKVCVTECAPTAEHFAREFLANAQECLTPHSVRVARVRVFETPTSWADYVP